MVMNMKPNDEMEEQNDNLLNEGTYEFVVTHLDEDSKSGQSGPIVMSEANNNPVEKEFKDSVEIQITSEKD